MLFGYDDKDMLSFMCDDFVKQVYDTYFFSEPKMNDGLILHKGNAINISDVAGVFLTIEKKSQKFEGRRPGPVGSYNTAYVELYIFAIVLLVNEAEYYISSIFKKFPYKYCCGENNKESKISALPIEGRKIARFYFDEIIPLMTERTIKRILDSEYVNIAGIHFSERGVELETGLLMLKKRHKISYRDIRLEYAKSALYPRIFGNYKLIHVIDNKTLKTVHDEKPNYGLVPGIIQTMKSNY